MPDAKIVVRRKRFGRRFRWTASFRPAGCTRLVFDFGRHWTKNGAIKAAKNISERTGIPVEVEE